MKRLFLVALAAIAMVACTKDEVVSIKGGDAIVFADAFVDNATRAAADPSITTNSIDGFNVWGFMDNTNAPVFEGDEVTKGAAGWTYTNTQYWFPSHNYYFAALAPIDGEWEVELADGADAELGLGEVSFTNLDGSEDLLYATDMVATPADINQQPEAVKLQFKHLLSKVKFTFKNGFGTDAGSIVVEDIVMSAPKNATIDLVGANDWVLGAESVDLAFGDVDELSFGQKAECADERLTIPADANQVYKVNFTVKIYVGDELAQTFNEETEITGVALEAGKAYNFVAELNPANLGLFPITFDVVVDEWDDEGDVSVDPRTKYVKNVTELQNALDAATSQKGYNIVMTDDIVGNVTATQKVGVNIVLNGQGYKYDGTIYVSGQSGLDHNKSLTIKNVNFETDATALDFINSSTDALRYACNLTVEDCTFTGPGVDSDVVAIRMRQSYGIAVKNCEATGVHSLAQITSSADMIFDGIEVDGGRGMNLQNSISGEVSFNDCVIVAHESDGYGIRMVIGDKEVPVSNSDITAYEPIVLRGSQVGAVLNITNSTLNETKQKINDEQGNATIFIDGVPYGYTVVTNDSELAAALVANAKIVLNGDFGHIVAVEGMSLWGINGAEVESINLNAADNVTLKNIKFDAANSKMSYDKNKGGEARFYANILTGDKDNNPLKGAYNLVIDGCNFTGTFANGGTPISFGDRKRTEGGSGNITIKNCTFDTKGGYYDIYGWYFGQNGALVIKNNVFASEVSSCPIYLGRYQSNVPVVVEGNDFKNVANFEAAASIQAHSESYNVKFNASDNTFGN